jgi:hypothetical protein
MFLLVAHLLMKPPKVCGFVVESDKVLILGIKMKIHPDSDS